MIILEGPDGLDVDSVAGQLRAVLQAHETPRSNGNKAVSAADEPVRALKPNKQLVEALKWRVRVAGIHILTRDVIHVADVDESEFYKWQCGKYVGKRTRMRCQQTVALTASAFISRLNEPVC